MAEPFLAEIRPVSFNFAPRGWALCNGQLLPINQNQALFSLLGTTYGGNGQTTFALPNLQSRVPVHTGSTNPLGAVRGTENHTLIVSELPRHTHALAASTSGGASVTPAASLLASPQGPLYAPGPPDVTLTAASVTVTGGNQSHNNLPPYLVINYIIALTGIYPSRN
ncbi:phage tail protein [Deinococcus sp. UR1]|uniref:phage tail protein n=1 Tax=Deinococcus sp. UR1 TaxID=1704277 RepID=UPI000C18CA54|nr:tail fiber protein [Deinococcus sp. UR1]PIG96203.1 phage tail protein [Deinococcus sp. UR1]